MKKFLMFLVSLVFTYSVFAVGENVPTSKSYIDSAVAQKQDRIERTAGATQAITNTGTAGEYGTKDIYDSNGSYLEQMDALVDAATMNAGVQKAIETEFQCVEYNPNDPTDCWLMKLGGISDLPNGYTQLEYIITNDGAYIRLPGFGTGDTSFDMITTRLCTDPYKGLYGAASSNSWAKGTGLQTHTDNAIILLHGNELIKNNAMTNNTEVHITQNKNIYTFTDINGTRTYTQPEYEFQTEHPIRMGAIQAHNLVRPCASIWKYFKVSNMVDSNGNILPDVYLLPALRNSDGVVGMYDTENNVFYTNAGSGEFIAGPVINLYMPSGN